MSKEKGKTQNKKRKLTRQEKKQIDALIRQSKGDGKPHTAQDSIPFERMYKDGICRLANGRYSKCIEFEDINYQLAQPDDKTATIEQNDNNFDGLINNTPQTPTVADFEQRAKAGEAISVTDLAKAVKAEKREQPQKKPSILKKLDEYKKQAAQQPKDKQKEHKKELPRTAGKQRLKISLPPCPTWTRICASLPPQR